MSLKFDADEFPSFQVWVERMKKQSPTFKYRNQGQQRDQYYKERENFNYQKNDAEEYVPPSFEEWHESVQNEHPTYKYHDKKNQLRMYQASIDLAAKEFQERLKIEKQKADLRRQAQEHQKVVEVMLNHLDITTLKLAKITKLVVERTDLTDLKELAPLLKDPSHLNEALDEFCESIKALIRAELVALVEPSLKGSSRIIKEEPKITFFLDNLCDKSVRMAKGMIAEELGSDACFDREESSKDLIRKTKKWDG